MAVELTRWVWEELRFPAIVEHHDGRHRGVELKLLLLSLCDHADEKRLCWPSVARLMAVTGLSERFVQRGLQLLMDRGLILRMRGSVGGRGRTSIYSVLPNIDVRYALSVPDQNPAPGTGYANNGEPETPHPGRGMPTTDGQTPHPGRGSETETPSRTTENPVPGTPGTTKNHEPPRARAREADTPTPPAPPAAPSTSRPPPTGNPELDALIGAITVKFGLPTTSTPPEPRR